MNTTGNFKWRVVKDSCEEYPLAKNMGLDKFEVFYGARMGGLKEGTILSKGDALYRVHDGNVIKIDKIIESKDELSNKHIKGSKRSLSNRSSRESAKTKRKETGRNRSN